MNQDLFAFLSQGYPLSDGMQERLMSILRYERFNKKVHLLREGQICNHIYFIERGLLRIYYVRDGLEICSGLLGEGKVAVSVDSFFGREISYEFIQTIEETTVHYISFDDLESLYKDFLEFNVIGRKLITEYYRMSERRNYLLRGLKAQEKFKYFQDNFGNLVARVPRKDIASYLGITLETLSRLGH